VIDPERLRSVLRLWASGVTVVTAQHQGVLHGMTVSSFSSVSLDGSLVAVNIERRTRTHRLISESGSFAICILQAGQRDLAQRFGGALPDHADRFSGLDYSLGELGNPIPAGCLAAMECKIAAAHPAETHTVFLGEVFAVQFAEAGTPLLYFNRKYRQLSED
jgi:flavin reductase (DIM6/NTAB) family NADH-FMN oxidoreductase RutF